MATTATTQFPGLTLEIAPGTNMKTAAVSWTDITVDLRGFGINRGRERELDQFQAGTATFLVNNRTRKYDPEYSAGTFFGNLVPMMQIRLRSTYAAVTSPLFYGYVESYPQSYPGYDADGVVELVAVDGFAVLASAQLPDSLWAQAVMDLSPDAWYRLGEQYGEVMGDSSGNGRHGTYNAPIVNSQQGIVPYSGENQALQFDGVDDFGIAPYLDSTNLTVAFWAKMPAEIPEDQLTFTYLLRQDAGDDGDIIDDDPRRWGFLLNPGSSGFPDQEPGHLQFIHAEGASGSNPKYSDVKMLANRVYFITGTYNGTTDLLYVNGVAQTEDGFNHSLFYATSKNALLIGGVEAVAGSVVAHSWNSILDEVVLWSSVLTPANIADLYGAGVSPANGDSSGVRLWRILDVIGWPASLRDVDTGTSVLGPATLGGKALDYLQLVAQTEAGLFYMTADGNVRLVGRNNLLTEAAFSTSGATFGDGAGEMDYHDLMVDPMNIQQVNNIGRVSRQGGVDQEYEDTTSSTKYGPRDISRSGLLMGTDGEAAGLAKSLVLLRKDPQFRVDSLTITPGRDPANLFPKVLAYELGQKVTVTRRPQGLGSAITKEVRIEGIRHEVDAASRLWTTTYATSPVDPNEDNWAIVGSGLVGTHLVSY